MSKILPLQEIEEELSQPELRLFPDTNPRVFSIKMAACLMNLCAFALSGNEAIRIEQQADDIYAAFNSKYDPADLLNVRGQTRVQSVPFGQGQAYGPLVEAYRAEVSGKLSEFPPNAYG